MTLLGEALGEAEAEHGAPFVGKAGFKLTRLIEMAGLDRGRFDILNAVWCRPPDNLLDEQPYEVPAIAHCRTHHWGSLLSRSNVVVPMGNVALGALTGRKGILAQRGYVRSGGPGVGYHILPTVHPSFIQRGQNKYAAAFILDLQKSVDLARGGLPLDFINFSLDPSPRVALEWARGYVDECRRAELAGGRVPYLAFDIETPGKGDDEETLDDEDDPTYHIYRIGFAYAGDAALSIPWEPPYMAAIKLLMEGTGPKVVWNESFDVPRVRAGGVNIGGQIHDGMIAWHVLHSDLPKKLGFVATFTCPWMPEWKSTSHTQPAKYNALDALIAWRSMMVIEEELKKVGLWGVYERDVLELDRIFLHMTEKGMPVDAERRLASARRLTERAGELVQEMEKEVPIEARSYSPKEGYIKTPDDTAGLITIGVRALVRRCNLCGVVNPTKPHFKTLKRPTAKKPQNPCAGGVVVSVEEEVTRFTRLDPFKPSRVQLMRYNTVKGRLTPTRFDKKTQTKKPTMDEKALKTLRGKYPADPLYPLVLSYRDVDKIKGTYIGTAVEG